MSRKDDLRKKITKHQRRLQMLKEPKAKYETADISPEILAEIEDIEAQIKQLQTELGNLEKPAIPFQEKSQRITTGTSTFIKLKNPYTFGVPVRGEGKFFGREKELQLIFDTLENVPRGQKQDMVVLGPRRIGKSSLLYRLVDLLTPSQDFVPVYVDVQNIKPRKIRVLFLKILQRIKEGYGQRNLLAALPSFDTLEANSIPADLEFLTLDEDMTRLNNAIANQNLPRLVLMFDEVELLAEFGGVSTLEWFRGLIQSLNYCIFIVAGSDRLYELTLDYTSPFYNIFKTIEVRALAVEAAKLLIETPAKTVGLTYPSSEIDSMLHYTGKNPYFIQAMGHYLIELLNQSKRFTIQPGDVDKIAPQVIDYLSAQFNYFWGSFDAMQRGLLYLLARKQKPQTVPALAREFLDLTNIRLSERQQRDLFVKLSRQQAIEPLKETKNPPYWFVVQLFADWICAKIKREEIIDNIREAGIVETVTSTDQDYIESLQKRLTIHLRNLYQLQEQSALYGPGNIPLSFFNQIEAEKLAISEIEERLRHIKTEG